MSEIARSGTAASLTLALVLLGTMSAPWLRANASGSAPDPSPGFKVKSEVVRVPVVVMDKKGQLYTDLEKEQFTILEDGIEQPLSVFTGGESAMNIVLLLEYSRLILPMLGEVVKSAALFVSQMLQPQDYAAMVSFDIKPQIVSDFSGRPGILLRSLRGLVQHVPFYRESSLYDALEFTLYGNINYTGLSSVEGRTAVLLIASGKDTLSKINFDEARRVVTNAGVPIYSIDIGEASALRANLYMSDRRRLSHYQTRNTLRAFSKSSGGRSSPVRFQADVGGVLKSIVAMIRFQYTLGYPPTNERQKGKKRKIEVLVDVDGDGRSDNKRLEIQHRRFYIEPKAG